MANRALKDMTGIRFGSLVAVAYAGAKKWLLRCDCGAERLVAGADLRRRRTRSCGCHGGLMGRFWGKVEKQTECWLWTASRTDDGYGQIKIDGRVVLAHRWAWEQEHGPVPGGLELDHTCRNRACVRPAHLEAVTHQENVRRGNMRSVVKSRGFMVVGSGEVAD